MISATATVDMVWADLGSAGPGDGDLGPLSAAEQARASRYRYPGDRARFVRRRCALRTALAGALGTRAGLVHLVDGPAGKPELGGDQAASGIRFNVSSSGDVAVVALSRDRSVGVDVERVVAHDDLASVAARFFSPAERRAVLARHGTDRLDAFYACWTLKEAFVKARGDGLSLPLDGFDVDIAARRGSALTATRWDEAEAGWWDVHHVPAPDGYAAALAVDVRP